MAGETLVSGSMTVLNVPIERRDSLADQVVQRVAEAIVSGELAPGVKIKEADIARRLGVSRGPLREAMGRLEAKHLVERNKTSLQVVELTPQDLTELFMVREVMEGLACRLAAGKMTDAEIADLDGLLDRHNESAGLQSGSSYYQRADDEDFHFRIVHGSKNKVLIQTLCEELYYLVRCYRYRSSMRPGRARDSLAEHREIVKALKSRDGDRAEMAMRRHIICARGNLVWAAGDGEQAGKNGK
jgi:DNA-binding GntR family transcriptional regulator